MGQARDLSNRIDGSDRVGGIAYSDELCPVGETKSAPMGSPWRASVIAWRFVGTLGMCTRGIPGYPPNIRNQRSISRSWRIPRLPYVAFSKGVQK
jgi:hypothetical protein